MSEKKQPGKPAAAQPAEQEREYTPEELRKAERTTWILYGVMAVMILAPFAVLLFRD